MDFVDAEKKIVKYWREKGIFEKSVKRSKEELVFYDGPPFPTGVPHYGTIFVSIIKDALARFFTMAGYSVPRRLGWDCHGLPIENAVEKKLSITNKTMIEKSIGVAAFNDECRKLVSECNIAWEEYITKIGRWVDYANAYSTQDRSYMESVLWVFKQCYEKGLIYKDYRVTPYCYHCETSLSISDTRESDSTRPRQDPEIIVAFKAKDAIKGKSTYYLAWTTTPWTLTSNLALAVGSDFSYVAIEHKGSIFILSEALLKNWSCIFGNEPKVVKSFSGSQLAGRSYEPIFPYFISLSKERYFKIFTADFVTLDDGVGIVHCAPAFGEEDYWLCKRHGLGVKNPVDSRGCFTNQVSDFAGRNVHDANKDIIYWLKEKGHLLLHRVIVHNYPHCWRCRTPLIYRAMDAWYFAVEKIKDKLIERNEDINWIPEHVKHGRFGKWLEGARDWNISRTRYWGTPIPVWECENAKCGKKQVFGSIKELEAVSGKKITDLHKEYLDQITFACPSCGHMMKRVPEVLDCWFESGAMPFGQCHYPFENKDWFEKHFPADFIVEYPGQIRGWFYYLHVLAVAILDRASYKNCLVHGTLLSADGTKISKSKKNFTNPMDLINSYSADALRLYLLNSPAVVMEDLNFKDSGVEEQIRRVLLPLWNAYSFFNTYAEIDHYTGNLERVPESEHRLDRWILALLYNTTSDVTQAYKAFYLNRSLSPVLEFIDALTNWYIRCCRERFWSSGFSADKKNAYDTLYYVLINLLKLLAPAAPFISEELYRNLTGEESIHLSNWPAIPEKFSDSEIIRENKLSRLIVSLGLALRHQAGIKVRQPLPGIKVVLPHSVSKNILARQVDVIKNELNVKEVVFLDEPETIAEIRVVPDPRILGPRYGKEVQSILSAAKAGQVRIEADKAVIFLKDESSGSGKVTKEWRLNREDVSIIYQGKDGANVLSDQEIVVALDTAITAQLRQEGITNELNRIIQDLRKKAGYRVSDRIYLDIKGDMPVRLKQHLAKLALADLVSIKDSEADQVAKKEIAGNIFRLAIRKP